MLRFKEAQVRALEEMEEKHQAMSEEAQQEKEEERKLLVTVCTHFKNTLNDAAADSLMVSTLRQKFKFGTFTVTHFQS